MLGSVAFKDSSLIDAGSSLELIIDPYIESSLNVFQNRLIMSAATTLTRLKFDY